MLEDDELDPPLGGAEEAVPVPVPCAQALVAGTVALMTAWADPCPDGTLGQAGQRHLLARKVVSNLFFLQQHPALGNELKQVMARAHQRWVGLAQTPAAPPATEPVVPLSMPGRVLH